MVDIFRVEAAILERLREPVNLIGPKPFHLTVGWLNFFQDTIHFLEKLDISWQWFGQNLRYMPQQHIV